MKVRDAMHRGAEWVGPDTAVSEVARKMRDLDIGAIPVGENDRLVGMVTDRDIACRAVADGNDCNKLTTRDVMTKGVVYCLDSEDVDDAIRHHGAEADPPAPSDQREEALGRHAEPW